jgi:hypothetical protein
MERVVAAVVVVVGMVVEEVVEGWGRSSEEAYGSRPLMEGKAQRLRTKNMKVGALRPDARSWTSPSCAAQHP